MSAPTKDDLLTMNFAFQGQPFVNVGASPSIDTRTLDWAFLAQPFYAPFVIRPRRIILFE